LAQGIAYYQNIAKEIEKDENQRKLFITELKEKEEELKLLGLLAE
jgi:hypothetical protein